MERIFDQIWNKVTKRHCDSSDRKCAITFESTAVQSLNSVDVCLRRFLPAPYLHLGSICL